MKTHLSAVLKEFTAPAAISVEEKQTEQPAGGQLLLAMSAAPINPADLNVLEGKYGELPELPAVVGNEGAGRVLAVGEGVEGFSVGDLVLPMQRGTWTQRMLVPAESAIRLPASIDEKQAAMLSVNPATALRLLRTVTELKEGDWVLQNAANSGVGRSVILLSKILGFKTLSVVRREDAAVELRELGGDAVILEEDDLREAVKANCGKNRPKLGLNSVGGTSAVNLANGLANGGTLVTFGAMGRQPVKIPNAMLIFRDLRFTGFWLTRWVKGAPQAEKQALYQELAGYVCEGRLRQPVAGVYPLRELAKALDAAAAERRGGKVLLDLSEGIA